MKIVHILKRIETIDNDIKDLRKLEKILQKDKSFSTPIYMSIEKQINIMLGERIKLLELEVKNPPQTLVNEIEGEDETEIPQSVKAKKTKKAAKKTTAKKTANKKSSAKTKSVKEKPKKKLTGDIPLKILTQDQIDSKFETMSKEIKLSKKNTPEKIEEEESKDVKLLDIALQKGTLNKKEITKEKERVRFFRDNFPGND